MVNDEKTHLVVMCKRNKAPLRDDIEINTGSGIVKPFESERLLGVGIHQSLKWKDHILEGKCSLLCTSTGRLNAIRMAAHYESFKTRLSVANACFMYSLAYMMIVWGGAENYIIRSIQVLQNKAARTVTKKSWFTPTKVLLKQCNC